MFDDAIRSLAHVGYPRIGTTLAIPSLGLEIIALSHDNFPFYARGIIFRPLIYHNPEMQTKRKTAMLFRGHTDDVTDFCMTTSEDGVLRVLTSSMDKTIRIWDMVCFKQPFWPAFLSPRAF